MVVINNNFELLKEENKLYFTEVNFSGEGFVEDYAVIRGKLNGRFYLGAYSQIDFGAICNHSFIGRFSIIERNCFIGRKRQREAFSNHPFVYGDAIASNFKDSYYSKLKTKRFFYEKDQICFIGNDVVIGQNSVITEGISIGDGALIHPNSFVDSNIPPYAIVAGSPAVVLGYRFDSQTISNLVEKKWWKYDLSKNIEKYKGVINYVNNKEILNDIIEGEANTLLEVRKFYLNSVKKIYKVNDINTAVIGPSHIQIWHKKWMNNDLEINNFYLLPIAAMSLMSDQCERLVSWWVEWFNQVILFVPDFRIGNITTFDKIKDGRFIEPFNISQKNDLESYDIGIRKLDKFYSTNKVYFVFWCLYGRESLNRKNKKFINDFGEYHHPIWNYSHMVDIYSKRVIEVSKYFGDIEDYIVDNSIHPTDECYNELCRIINTI